MANISAGFANSCTDGTCPGGIGTLYLANANQVSAVAENSSGGATAITMTSSAAVFYPVEFRDDSGVFTSTVTVDPDTLAKSVELTLTGILTCRTQAMRNFINSAADQACGFVVVHVENTGRYWIWGDVTVGGKRRPARLTSAEGNSGTAFSDPNQETITLTCRTNQKEKELINGAVVMAALD
jgi:hypothetical protein